MQSRWSNKQKEYFKQANARWNIKTGATRSGKTYLDYFMIPYRIAQRAGEDGLVLLMGNTKGTLQRNIITPMQNMYPGYVSPIRSDNTVDIFGQRCFCLGADNAKQVGRVQGMSIKYAYGDEITTWNKDVFEMLKSRLDKPCSCFDGTCNPESELHWFKKFLDSDADIYHQHYTIDDNPYLSPAFVEALKQEYSGTVYYDRYIEGRWVAAEGVIYEHFANNPERYIVDEAPPVTHAVIGVDFGGTGSGHAFSCVGFTKGFRQLVLLDEWYHKGVMSPTDLERAFVSFVKECQSRWLVSDIFCDSAEQTLIQGFRCAAEREGIGVVIGNARKKPINDRIRCMCLLMGGDRFKVVRHCIHTINALRAAVWDSRAVGKDVRLDDGNYNIDSLDALEYAFEREIMTLIEVR